MKKFLFGLLTGLALLTSTHPAQAAITLNWIDWTAPGSYPESATYAPSGSPGGDYTYAASATGSITMPDASTANVTFSGEIVNPASWPWADASSIYGAPSGFASASGTTTADYWDTRPGTNASTFTSDNATPPTNGDHIGLVGSGSLSQNITFSSPVSNIVMTVYSLGSDVVPASWDFSQDFVILSDNNGASRFSTTGSGLTKSLVGGMYRLGGSEGSGTIQFLGDFSSLEWSVSAPEIFSTWNIGVTSATAPSAVPEPGQVAASLLLLAGIGGYVVVKRRRAANPAA